MNDTGNNLDKNGINERNKTYEPNEIPRQITRGIWVAYGISGYGAGRITLNDFDYHGSDDSALVTLCQTSITIDIPAIDRDGLKTKALEVLEAEKQKVMAENHQRLRAVQDKIDNLLAIEFKPQEAA
jgi:hypothetical protein